MEECATEMHKWKNNSYTSENKTFFLRINAMIIHFIFLLSCVAIIPLTAEINRSIAAGDVHGTSEWECKQ